MSLAKVKKARQVIKGITVTSTHMSLKREAGSSSSKTQRSSSLS